MSILESIPLFLILLIFSGSSFSQQAEQGQPIAIAQRHIAKGEYQSAIEILTQQLQSQPKDGEALRILARAYYWSGNMKEAEARYKQALSASPLDAQTRLEVSRFLIETGRYDTGEKILSGLRTEKEVIAEAEVLRGSSAYWQGDWTSAAHHFESALRIRANHEEAKRQLGEIRSATAPRLSISPEYQSDDQPIRRYGGLANFTWHVTPLLPISLEFGSSQLSINDTARTTYQASMTLRNVWARARVGVELGAGFVRLSNRQRPEGSYRIGISFRLPESFQLLALGERSPYFETTSSFSIPVTSTSLSFIIDHSESPNWIGQASYRFTRYSDANTGRSLYAWTLVPVYKNPLFTLRAGYGFSFQDTREDRFVLVSSQTLFGTYAPYYTPISLQSHSVLALLESRVSDNITARVNGSYGFIAREQAPSFQQVISGAGPDSSSIVKQFAKRSFSPWRLQASVDLLLSSHLWAKLEATRQETAYYQVRLVRLNLAYTFLPDPQ